MVQVTTGLPREVVDLSHSVSLSGGIQDLSGQNPVECTLG